MPLAPMFPPHPINYLAGEDITDADLLAERNILAESRPYSMLDILPAIGRLLRPGLPGPLQGAIGPAPVEPADYADVELPPVAQVPGVPGVSPPVMAEAKLPPTSMELKAEPDPAAFRPSPTRAIRMPDGRLVFTNRPELGGDEISMADAAAESRAKLAQIDPTSRTMSALVRAAARANAGAVPPPPPEVTRAPGPLPSFTGPEAAVSIVEGTPAQRAAIDIESALAAATLAGLQAETARAKLSPQEKADLENREIGTMSWLDQKLTRTLDAIERVAAAAITKAQALPAGPARDNLIRQIEGERDRKREAEIQAALALQGRSVR